MNLYVGRRVTLSLLRRCRGFDFVTVSIRYIKVDSYPISAPRLSFPIAVFLISPFADHSRSFLSRPNAFVLRTVPFM